MPNPPSLWRDPVIWAITCFLYYLLYQAVNILDKSWGYFALGAVTMLPVVQWAFHLGRKRQP